MSVSEEIVELTKRLIEFRTVHSKPEEIDRCADFIEAYLKRLNVVFHRLNHETTPSLYVLPAEDFAPVLLMSHFDVVEGADHLFKPSITDGKLYGRGAIDDKYAVALSLVLLKQKLQNGTVPQSDLTFGILLTGDEEAGGENGAQRVLSKIRTDFCIALDGGSVNEVITKEKGILQLRLISKGKSAHGARPWLGENAIETLIQDCRVISGFFTDKQPNNWHRTLNLSRIEAGKSFNQVPDHAEAVFDIRYTENDDIDDLLDQMQSAIRGRIEIHRREPLFTAKPSPYIDLLTGSNPGLRLGEEHGSSDARYLSLNNINGIVWGADGDLSHHSDQEHIRIESISRLYNKLDRFVQECRGIMQ